tara:strand:+ start:1566 stop:2267 length:702 start_codon:yes stop_codon:yes gene_type:complete
MKNSALVLFSGGQDSTICLAWALKKYDYVETIGFKYNQRHSIELNLRPKILNSIVSLNNDWGKKLGLDHLVETSFLGEIFETSLTRNIDISFNKKLPNTFIPGRNLIFFSIAAAFAYKKNIHTLVGGMCSTDFSGYPDCRKDPIMKLEESLNLGMEFKLKIETPLMYLTKNDSLTLAEKIAGKSFIKLIIKDTHTCYLGDRNFLHNWGYGCNNCPACHQRRDGFKKYFENKNN